MKHNELIQLLGLFLKDIEKGVNVPVVQQRQRMKLLYLFETQLELIKEQYKLPKLNNSIESRSILNGFDNKVYVDWNGQLAVESKPYLKTTDYQYWLIVFLLLKYHRIVQDKSKLYEIVDVFIDRYKRLSFSYNDIELTKSGQTRCKTNIKFAFADLCKLGLVNSFRYMKEARWSLTYLGFMLAVSIILDPDKLRASVFSRFISRVRTEYYHKFYSDINKTFPWHITLSSGYNIIDPFLLFRLSQLRDIKYFSKISNKAKLEYFNIPILKDTSRIFDRYYSYVIENINQKSTKEMSLKNIGRSYEELDEEHEFYNFLKITSEGLDAEAFLTNLIKSARGVIRENQSLKMN